MGSFSIWHWLVVLLIVVLIFGTKKLKNIGTDLGGAVKGFKDGVREGGTTAGSTTTATTTAADGTMVPPQVNASRVVDPNTIDVEAKTRS